MSQTKTIADSELTAVRTNDDANKRLVVTVTYDDATTEELEFNIVRTVSS